MANSTVALISMMPRLVGVIMATAMFNQPCIPIDRGTGSRIYRGASGGALLFAIKCSPLDLGGRREVPLLAFLDSDWERVIWRPISVGIQVLHKIGTGSECRKEGITVRKAAHVQGVAFVIDIFSFFLKTTN